MLKEPGNGPPPSRATPECALPPPPHPPPTPWEVGSGAGDGWILAKKQEEGHRLHSVQADCRACGQLGPCCPGCESPGPQLPACSKAERGHCSVPEVPCGAVRPQAVQEGMRPNQGAYGLHRPLHPASLCWPCRGRAPPAGKCWAGALSRLGTPSPSRPGQCGAPLQWLVRCTRVPRASGHSGGGQRPRRPKEGGSDGQARVLGWLTALTCNSLVAGWLELSGSWALC